jgi:hypothetical protein
LIQKKLTYTKGRIKKIHTFIDKLFTTEDFIGFTVFPELKKDKKKKFLAKSHTGFRDEVKTKYLNSEYLESIAAKNLSACISPNPFTPGGRRANSNVDRIKCVFVDIDSHAIDLDCINPIPTMICQRTEDKTHLYWFIEPLPANKKNHKLFTEVENLLIDQLGGDHQAKAVSNPFRIPYTYHLKNINEPSEYKVIKSNKKIYNLETLRKSLKTPEIEREQTPVATNDVEILKFLKRSYSNREKIGAGEGRSRELYYVGTDCYKWGLEKAKALDIAQWFNDTIFTEPEDSITVEHQINSAYRYTKEDFGEYKDDLKLADTAKKKKQQFADHQDNQRLRSELKHCVYIKETERLYDIETSMGYTKTQIAAHLSFKFHTQKSILQILYHKLIRVVDKEDFRPDLPNSRFFKKKKITYVNRYNPIKIEEVDLKTSNSKKVVKRFTDHLEYLATAPIEYQTLLNWLAYVIQNPGKKIPWTILISSRHTGLGKSMIGQLLANIYGPYSFSLRNKQLKGQFTDYLTDKLILIVHELFTGDRKEVSEDLKDLITESEATINGKHARAYDGTNCINFLMFSNHRNAAYIDETDRRFFVIRNEKPPKSEGYYNKLAALFKKDYACIFHYLKSVDLSKFNPYKRPPMTAGKLAMIEQSESEAVLYLRDLQKNPGSSPFSRPIFRTTDLLNHMELHGPKIVVGKAGAKAITNFLVDAGFTQRSISVRSNGGVTSCRLWGRNWKKIKKPAEQAKLLLGAGGLETSSNVLKMKKTFEKGEY